MFVEFFFRGLCKSKIPHFVDLDNISGNPPPHYTAYVFSCNAECLFKLASVLYNFIILVCIDSLLVFYAANSFFLC